MYARAVTLSQFLLQQERAYPGATGEFTGLLHDIQLAAKMINREVIRAGLTDVLGYTGSQNVHGERVQKLDLFAHQTISRVLGSTGQLAVMASEEDEDIIPVAKGMPVGRYVVNFDPLDGSSNINAGVNIGTIFSVLPRVTTEGGGTPEGKAGAPRAGGASRVHQRAGGGSRERRRDPHRRLGAQGAPPAPPAHHREPAGRARVPEVLVGEVTRREAGAAREVRGEG